MVKANDEKVDLVFVNAANDGIDLVPIHQVSTNLNAFGRKLFREGNRLKTCIECCCQLNRRGQGAASLWRFIIRYRNISKH